LLHLDCLTVTGRTVAENLSDPAPPAPDGEVVRRRGRPIHVDGGIAVLRGSLAPKGAVVKVAGIDVDHFAGPARVFDGEDGAIEAYRSALDISASYADAQYNLAYALLQTSRRDQAMAILRPLVSAHPTHAQAQYQLGKTLLDMDETKEAIPHLEAAAQANPDLDYVHYQLQMAYRKAGRGTDADREARLYREIKDRKRAASPTAH